MPRAHLYRPVTDETGKLLYGAQVTVRESANSYPIAQTLYADDTSTTTLTNPLVLSGGFIDLWLETPQRVNLLIQSEGRDDIQVFLDVQPAAEQVVRSTAPLTILSAPVSGKVLMGVAPGQADWQDPPVASGATVPVHYHEGTGTDSVALGDGAVGSGSQATAVGDNSVASGNNATAFGYLAQASDFGTTAVGASAAAQVQYATALGYAATATANSATAVGANAAATGASSSAVGSGASASDTNATAFGYLATASAASAGAFGAQAHAAAVGSVALGAGATVDATHTNSVAIGNNARTTAANQVMLGTNAHTTMVQGALQALGDAQVGSPTSSVGFFGSLGAALQSVSGDDGGDPTLRALLSALGVLGLVNNQTTQGTALSNPDQAMALALSFGELW